MVVDTVAKQKIFLDLEKVYDYNLYGPFVILHDNGPSKVEIKFLNTGFIKIVDRFSIKAERNIKDPFRKEFNGVGYFGVGPYSVPKRNKDMHQCYRKWRQMLIRCYDPENKHYHRYGGRGVVVCEEWHNFQNFAHWYFLNYKEDCSLDKDLTMPGALLYSPETCAFVPEEVNNLLCAANSIRGNLPVGVSFSVSKGQYRARVYKRGVEHTLGFFDTPEEAFNRYKEEKEAHIKEMADYYFDKGLITKTIRDNLMAWVIVEYPD